MACGSDSIHTQPAWLEDSPPDQLLEAVPLSEIAGLPDEAVPGVPSTGKKSQLPHLAINSTNSRARLPAMRRRAQSPVCLRNPFLEDNADTLQKLNSEGRVLEKFVLLIYLNDTVRPTLVTYDYREQHCNFIQ